ncbi:MAG: hypothetical protein ACRDPE_23530 [Solirubrobacterales bacterium]
MSFNNAPTRSSLAKNGAGKLTVKATSQVLVLDNPDRVGIYVDNPSTSEVWLALGETATASAGIWLKKEVGSKFITGYSGPISCITTTGESNVPIAFAEI